MIIASAPSHGRSDPVHDRHFRIFMNRKNVIVHLMSLEMILMASTINLSHFSAFSAMVGQVFALLVRTVAAAEAAIGRHPRAYNRNRGSIAVEDHQPDEGLNGA